MIPSLGDGEKNRTVFFGNGNSTGIVKKQRIGRMITVFQVCQIVAVNRFVLRLIAANFVLPVA